MIKRKGTKKHAFIFHEDWAKTIHLHDSKFFIAGGSHQVVHAFHPNYSNKAFILDTQSGLLSTLPNMTEKRQAHGMLLINNYVYCCGGLNGHEILKTCERFDISKPDHDSAWDNNLPELSCAKFSMTMLLMDKQWIYSFGGAT